MKWTFFLLSCLFPLLTHSQSALFVPDYTVLDQKIDSILKAQKVPGAQLAIVGRDSVLWLGNYGYADLQNNTPVTAETMFRIGSVTKSFVAVSVMMLVEEGQLRLDDKIKDLAPELPFENRWSDSDPVRLVHLLEHTTGFDDMHLVEYATQGEGWTTLEGLRFHPHSKRSRWRPGKHMSYCNSGPPMAAYVVEKKTGKPIESFIEERIFTPLGMTNSSLFLTETVKGRLSKGYSGKDQKEAPYWHIISRPAGAINSTATEMAQYLRFYLNQGMADSARLLSPASMVRIETPTSTLSAKAGIKEGYGLHIHSERYKGVLIYGHNGGMNGFLANMKYIPEQGVGYVYFINSSNGAAMNAINRALLDLLIPEGKNEPVEANLEIDPSLAGYYRTATSRNQLFRFTEWPANVIRIKGKEDKLFYKPLLGKEIPLQILGENLYRLEEKDHFSTPLVFVRDEDSNLIMQLPNQSGNYYRSSGLAVWGIIIFLNLCSLLVLSGILAALIWIPLWVFGHRKMRNPKARLWPLLASVSFLGFILLIVIGASDDPIGQLGNPTAVSLLIFVFSLLFPLSSVVSIWVGLKSFDVDMNRAARIHAFLIGLACFCLTAYLAYWGMPGVRLWAF